MDALQDSVLLGFGRAVERIENRGQAIYIGRVAQIGPINYGYDAVSRRTFTQRDGNGSNGTADGIKYDKNGQLDPARF